MVKNILKKFDEQMIRIFPLNRGGFRGHIIGLTFVAVAVIGRSLLSRLDVSSPPFITFFPAITLTALFGGFWPGLFSLLVSSILINYMFIPPFYTFTFKFMPGTVWSNVLFIFGEVTIITSVEIMYRNYYNAVKKSTVIELFTREVKIDSLLRQFFDLPFIGMAITDPMTKRWIRFNDRLCDILGYSKEELEQKTWIELTHPDDREVNIIEYNRVLKGESNGYRINKRFMRKDGSIIFASVDEKCVRKADGSVDYFMKTVQDITEQKIAEETIQKNERLLKSTLEILPVGVWIMDQKGNIILGNLASKQIWAGARYVGVEQFGEYKGWWLDTGAAIGAHEWAAARAIEKGETSLEEEIEIECFDGSRKVILNSALPIKGSDGGIEGAIIVNQDITARKKIEEKIRNLAFYDTLTQLPNRRLLFDRLELAMAASQRSNRYSALMYLDLDNFKTLNDSYGHDIGDLFLIEVAHRIKSCLREVDTVARLGGDEFVVILSELHRDKVEAAAQVGKIAEKIRAMLAIPFILKTSDEAKETIIEHYSGSSIGTVLFVNHKSTQEEILKRADTAMYQAKEDGGNSIRIFED